MTGPRATERDDRLIYDAGTGKLFSDEDGSGAGRAWQIAELDAGLSLTADDFHVL